MRKRFPRLVTPEQVRIVLDHVERFTITTADCLQKACFSGERISDVKRWLRSLARRNLLASQELFGPEELCYHLGKCGVKKLGKYKQSAGHLPVESLISAYGCLAFCTLLPVGTRRDKPTDAELKTIFSDSPRLPANWSQYYISGPEGREKLGYLRVDAGGSYRNLVRNAVADVRKRHSLAPIRELIADGSFEMGLVTSTPEKKKLIENMAAEVDFPVPLVVEAHPKLLLLLGERIEKRSLRRSVKT